ncbi:hypothetical protein [Streptomyces sp. HUAS TT7]|uniref:hypothetical protein n=1 Tax=Streptomyces sp. HUAS TT7 TaxID=3447507 RepID=UPI003F656ED1
MPFEDRLGEAMRHTGDSFELGDRRDLVESGLIRGRRRLARRRTAAVTGSVLALATVGLGGAYAAGLVGGGGGGSSVAAPSTRQADGATSGEEMVSLFKSLLPAGGAVTKEQGSGPGDLRASGKPGASYAASVSGVFDDGNGPGLIALGVRRVDPAASSSGEQVACPAKALVDHDSCQTEQRPDGSRYMLLQGYENPNRSDSAKAWRAVLLTPKGTLIDASEWNAPAQKGSPAGRETPPLTAGQLKALVVSPKWLSVADTLRAPEKADRPVGSGPSAEAVQKQLIALLPAGRGLKAVERGGQDGYAFVVVDDGRGKSLVQINVQTGMSDVRPEGTTSTLPDGTVIGLAKKSGEKGGAGVAMWIADTVRPDGFRVVISAFNTGNQNKEATRPEPALTLDELKKIALDPRWVTLK